MPPRATIVTPGVYLDNASRAQSPAFETGVPAFVGALSSAGAGDPSFRDTSGGPRVITALDAPSWSMLEARLGASWAIGYLGFAVRGFFENGGVRCHVVAPSGGDLDAALLALEALDGIDLVAAPDLAGSAASQAKILAWCDAHGGCFAILDAPSTITTSALLEHRTALAAIPSASGGANAALYAPWIKVKGACTTCGGKGRVAAATCATCWGTGAGFVPPSGHVAGVYSRTDRKEGLHKAPANEETIGVIDLQLNIGDAAQAELHPLGINCLRSFPGRGTRVWGARTLHTEKAWNQVNVRRTVLTIGRWLEQTMSGVAFEPNDLLLWARINREVGGFLEGLFERGALRGRTAAEAYFVKCDGETNSEETRNAGLVVTEVGVAPARPSEFVVVRLVSGGGKVAVTGLSSE